VDCYIGEMKNIIIPFISFQFLHLNMFNYNIYLYLFEIMGSLSGGAVVSAPENKSWVIL